MAALLNDPKHPPTNDERVRAANLYRIHRQEKAPPRLSSTTCSRSTPPIRPPSSPAPTCLAEPKKHAEAADAAPQGDRRLDQGEATRAVFYLMLAAVENRMPPAADAPRSAPWPPSTRGSQVQPDSLELVQAKYRLLRH